MRSMSGAPVILALAACVSLCCRVSGEVRSADEITLEPKQIFVKFENGPTFSLMLELDIRVEEVRDEINQREGLSSALRMQFGDDISPNYVKNLSDYNIQAGSIVTLVTPERHANCTVEFYVRTRQGRKLQVVTQRANLVSALKGNITQWTGIPPMEQRLLLKGKELKDDRNLAQYYLPDGATIDLGGPLEDCQRVVTIFVKTLSGATIELEVDLADTVDELKERIRKKAGIPVGAQRLFANERAITGEDHLCDLELKANSTVYMYLHSKRITSLDQVAKLREESPPVGANSTPIFREVGEDSGEHGQKVSPFKDARNWVTPRDHRLGWQLKLFDPVAHLSPNPDHEEWIQEVRENLERYSRPNTAESDPLKAVANIARLKLSIAIRPYRVAAGLKSNSYNRQCPGMTLGGGFIEVDPEKQIPLGADVNNWAPDAFSDADLMRLFEVSKRVRQLLARAEQTGEGILSIASQRRINGAILSTYLEALAGSPTASVYDETKEGQECGICHDDLTAEPAMRLACEHAFHADCMLSWVANSYLARGHPSCPYCRQRFMFPYEVQGKAELEAPEIQE